MAKSEHTTFLLSGLAALLAVPALACTPDYTVQEGDTVFSIAQAQLGSVMDWPFVQDLNPLRDQNVLDLAAGTQLALPCFDEVVARAAGLDETATLPDGGIRVLTGSDFAPFADQTWPEDGMLTEIVKAAFAASPAAPAYEVIWENEWSRHLFPLLDETQIDMGFPWFKPDCAATPEHTRCVSFHFSEPLVDLVILLFTRSDAPLKFAKDRDLLGKTLCRPAGYFTHDLDRPDRKWLIQGLVDLKQPDTPEACFELLMAGQVDAVAMNEFVGMQTMIDLDLGAAVTPLEKPLSEEALHVVISKKHWKGTTHLHRFNAGLRALKETPKYNEIVNRHLAHFWKKIEKG